MSLRLEGEDERQHTASHFTMAIVADPSAPEPYEHLAVLAPTLDEYAELFTGELARYTGTIAGRAALHARLGDLRGALRELAGLSLAITETDWTVAPWWPSLVETDRPRDLAAVLRSVAKQLPAEHAPLAPYLRLAKDLADRHPGDVALAVGLSPLAEAFGVPGVAVGWCSRAEAGRAEDAIEAAVAWQDLKRYANMELAYERAIAADPDRVETYVRLALALVGAEKPEAAQRCAARAQVRFRDSAEVRALRAALDYLRTRDVRALATVIDAVPDRTRPSEIMTAILTAACARRHWLNWVPMPTEPSVATVRQLIEQTANHSPGSTVYALACLDSPSAVEVMRSYVPDRTVAIFAFPKPDIREPLARVAYRVWEYRGTVAVPVLPPPPPATTDLVRSVAEFAWTDPLSAYASAARLRDVPLDELLGVIGHVPARPTGPRWEFLASDNVGYWRRLVVAWACLGILHHRPDEPWPTSTRRRVLLDLVNGLEDWTTDSALFAMITAAWIDPAVRDDVRATVRAAVAAATRTRRRREMHIAPSIVGLMLITPGCDDRDRAAAEALRKELDRPWSRGLSRKILRGAKKLRRSR
jgi:hypothetical protein